MQTSDFKTSKEEIVYMENKKVNPDIFNMVKAISDGNNVEAYKLLEKVTKQKIADKIDVALKD